MEQESITFDIVIVGAGPSGLAAAIRLKQLAEQHQKDISICMLEKGAEVGAHILSGAVLEPTALDELLPEWRTMDTGIQTPASTDEFLFLTAKRAFKLPIPKILHNKGNYLISLGKLCRFLGKEAEKLGVEIFPGFPASKILYDAQDTVVGIETKATGITKEGQHSARYQSGMQIYAKYTLFAEGCRGSLTKQLIEKFQLAKNCDPPTFALGVKELWEVDNMHHQPGKVIHSVGWPLDHKTYGGSFLYHLADKKIAMGFVVGLDYQNPYLSPFDELQKFKTHPKISHYFENGKRIAYGARTLVEGGFQSLPELAVPGALIIGDAAGFLNVLKIKGIHMAMKSGMVAADTLFEALSTNQMSATLDYRTQLEKSWLWQELYAARNIRPAFNYGRWFGLLYTAATTFLGKIAGKEPWTFKNHADYNTLKLAKNCHPPTYPTADGKLTFDKLSSVYVSNTNHADDQPCFIELKNPKLAIDVNLALYDSPERFYCPANVYEILQNAQSASAASLRDEGSPPYAVIQRSASAAKHRDEGSPPVLQINAQNCLECKSCDIKDPLQNINWTPGEGGGGPYYEEM